jgi:phage tail sheath gpL-like
VTVPQYVRSGVLASIRQTFRGKKIVDNTASGAPDPRPNVVQPRNIQSHVFGVLKQYEAQGIVDAVSEANVSAVRNTVNTRRVDIAFPCVPTQDLDTTAGQLRQRQPSLA